MSLEMTLYVSGVTWLAASLQGVTGVGFMILSVPGLILVLPAQVVVPGLILLYLPLGTVQVLQLRGDVDWRRLAYLVGSAAVGLPLGAVILRVTDTTTPAPRISVPASIHPRTRSMVRFSRWESTLPFQ